MEHETLNTEETANSDLDAVISRFTMEDLDSCWNDYPKERLINILNGDYTLEDARDDLRSLIGTKYDTRQNGL